MNMTREFMERLHAEFPEREQFRHRSYGYEQFFVRKLGQWRVQPTLDTIIPLAKRTLKRVKGIGMSNGWLQGAEEKEDIVIMPGYQRRCQSQALALIELDISLVVLFSTSWHTIYGMTAKQMDRYCAFAHEYFNQFG